MKLNVVPASTGLSWVKLGVKTFFRQPLAMSGLFFMFMAVVSVLSVVPFIGTAVSLALVPAATVGLMAASREALAGRFPMPVLLLTAFRSGQDRARAMLILGGMYAGALLLVVFFTWVSMREALRTGTPREQVEADADAALRAAGFVPDYAVIRRPDFTAPVDGEGGAHVALIAARHLITVVCGGLHWTLWLQRPPRMRVMAVSR